MLNKLYQFAYMNGYGAYIWSSYLMVLVILLAQWWHAWRKWRQYIKTIFN